MTSPIRIDSASAIGHNDPKSDPTSPLVDDTPLPFPQLCAKIHDRIEAFLDEKDVSPRVKGVQEQTRISLRVIEEALDRYRYVAPDMRQQIHGNMS